jgi:hypothetical protein
MIRPLGPWLRIIHECIQCVAYGYNECLAIKSGPEYEICTKRPDGYFEPSGRTVTLKLMPRHAVPVNVEKHGDSEWKFLKQTSIFRPSLQPFATTFSEFVNSLPPWKVDLLRHTALFVDPRMTCFSLQPHFFAGCDGSKFGNQGAFGWTVSAYHEGRAATRMQRL